MLVSGVGVVAILASSCWGSNDSFGAGGGSSLIRWQWQQQKAVAVAVEVEVVAPVVGEEEVVVLVL